MKNFFKKYIFARPDNLDYNSIFIMACGLAVVCSHFISCVPSKEKLDVKTKKEIEINQQELSEENDSHDYDDIEIREIDSCEYIIYKKYVYGICASGICHKANCNNSVHKNSK